MRKTQADPEKKQRNKNKKVSCVFKREDGFKE